MKNRKLQPRIYLVLITVFVLTAFSSSQSQSPFLGKWVLEKSNSNVIFYIHLFEKDSQIIGEHCFDNGVVEDCLIGLKKSLYNMKTINNGKVKFKFITGYGAGASSASDFIGEVKLTKINQNKIRWELVKKPIADFAVPQKTTLVRYQE